MSSATVRHQRTGGGQGGVRSALMKEKKKKNLMLVLVFYLISQFLLESKLLKPGFMFLLLFVASF